MALHDSSIIELRGVSRFPPRNERPHESAVQDVDLRVARGGWLWLDGPPDGGKELLFRLLSLGEFPDAGEVLVDARSCGGLAPSEVAELRARKFGFVSAAPFLIPSFNAIENIAVPLLKLAGVTMPIAQERIAALLNFTGLAGREERPAAELSALDQVRVTLARALANVPVALFVDDLGSTLSAEDFGTILALLRQRCEAHQVAVIALAGAGADGLALPEERRLDIIEGRIERDSALFGSAIS